MNIYLKILDFFGSIDYVPKLLYILWEICIVVYLYHLFTSGANAETVMRAIIYLVISSILIGQLMSDIKSNGGGNNNFDWKEK